MSDQSLKDSRLKRIYSALTEEGGATWATYMMMEIDLVLAATPSSQSLAEARRLALEEAAARCEKAATRLSHYDHVSTALYLAAEIRALSVAKEPT